MRLKHWIVHLAARQHFRHGVADQFTNAELTAMGAGKPLLPRRIITPPLKLISVKDYGHSFVQMVYALPKKGS